METEGKQIEKPPKKQYCNPGVEDKSDVKQREWWKKKPIQKYKPTFKQITGEIFYFFLAGLGLCGGPQKACKAVCFEATLQRRLWSVAVEDEEIGVNGTQTTIAWWFPSFLSFLLFFFPRQYKIFVAAKPIK